MNQMKRCGNYNWLECFWKSKIIHVFYKFSSHFTKITFLRLVISIQGLYTKRIFEKLLKIKYPARIWPSKYTDVFGVLVRSPFHYIYYDIELFFILFHFAFSALNYSQSQYEFVHTIRYLVLLLRFIKCI